MTQVMSEHVDAALAAILPRLTELRHDLHAHPQLAYHETYTSARVAELLADAGIEHETGLAETGVVGRIEVSDEPAVGLRADMDALPITEATDLPYASQNPGFMHACGHDGHTTVLIGAALVLNELRDRLTRSVRLVFQPAEEEGAGAKRMIDAGAIEGVGCMFGLHGVPLLPIGAMATCVGPMMAGTSNFTITVRGRGGHGAMPHACSDPIVAAAAIVTALQHIVSRQTDPTEPVVVTVGRIHGGSAMNVIPDHVEFAGTFRTMTGPVDVAVAKRIAQIAEQTAAAHGCAADVLIERGYPAVNNDEAATQFVMRTAAGVLGERAVIDMPRPILAGEDFAYYGQVVPACFSFIGVRPPEQREYPGLHTPRYDFSDGAIAVGVRLMCAWAIEAGPSGLSA